MRAQVGDEIVVHSCHVGEHTRVGVVLEARGEDGLPPYVVRWEDGREAVFFPSADTTVLHRKADGAHR
jgi:Domain of unknown function (DUF1918)